MKINVKIPKKINIGGIKTGTPSYTIPIASAETLGGIKVGENLTIDEDGTLNAQAGGSAIGEEKEIIQGEITNNYSVTLPKAWQLNTIPFDVEKVKLGNSLTLTSDGHIKIGSGISKARIEGNLLVCSTEIGILDARFYRIRNGTYTNLGGYYVHLDKAKDYRSCVMSIPILDVQENDEICIRVTSDVACTFTIADNAYLYVEKVNETNVISGKEEDTGWQDCEVGESGTWSRFKFRKIGSRVRIEGRVSNLPYNGLEYIIGKIPVEYAPPSVINTYGFTSKNIIARFNVNPSGEIKISWNLNMATGSENKGTSWYNFDFEYLLD